MARKTDYTRWSKEDIVKRVEALEKRKKYGLVWDEEREPEKVVQQCKEKLPILKEVKTKEIKNNPDKPTHILIEGDNYHALSVLNYTHAKKVGVIYIDPPYNTGARDWKYNNDYVDINDAFRHSKWLSFICHRLVLAKKLLSEDGILITAIDDNEFATLKLLLEELFASYTHETVVVNHHPQGSGGANVSATHEYAIVSVPKGKNLFWGEYIGEHIEEWSLIKAGAGRDYYRVGRPRMFFAIHVNKNTGIAVGVGPELKVTDKYEASDAPDGFKKVYPLDSKGKERRWRYGREMMKKVIEQGRIKASLPSFSMKVVMHRAGSFRPIYSNWTGSKYNAGPHGTGLLKEILPNTDFPFPKSLYTVIDFVAGASRNKKNAVVLDFFAGSGTTGHAVLELNKEDGGDRQFILCTNNEDNNGNGYKIAEDICYPRIKKVIKGYKNSKNEKVEGLGSNLKYFKTDFVPASPTDTNKEKLTKRSVEMLCLRENSFDLVSETDTIKIFQNHQKYMGILFDQLEIPKFKKIVRAYKKPISVYVFSLSDDDFGEEFFDMRDRVKVCSIPEAILRVYRRIFK